jgi:agmatine deiminase
MPDPNPRRLPAEWEPQSAVQLTFPHAGTDWRPVLPEVLPCFLEIARTVARYEKVLIVCDDAEATRDQLPGVPADRLLLVEAPSNDTWARDHGGITVEEHGRPLVLDFMFNGWGLKFAADKDNLLTATLAQAGMLQAPVQVGGLVLEGGGIESDGQGTLLTTAECLLSPNRNPHLDQAALEDRLKELFGLERILWLHHGYLAGDDTDSHIDTLARFCDPHTIAYVRCDDPRDEHYAALRAMEAELFAFRRADGQPYRLEALPWPEPCYDPADGHRLPATYANFLIVNGAVLVPTYRVPQDQTALAVFRKLFPARDVIGIDCRPLILQHGSLHCVTMQYPVGVV